MKKYFEKVLALFFILGMLFIPLNFNGKDGQYQITIFLYSRIIGFFQDIFFQNALPNIDFSSDTIALNLLLLFLFFVAFIGISFLSFFKINLDKFICFSRIISCYYISFILLKYGFDKVFKAQFYLPEPNILYTPFGNLTKDILYWSTLGTSYFYSLSMGIIEVGTAILILIKSTRVLGLLFSIAIFINIILINFGFDISVKTFSLFLLFASLFAVFPNLIKVINFLIFQKKEQLVTENKFLFTNIKYLNGLKSSIIGLIFLLILFPYFKSQNFNDDIQERPFLHGVYLVNKITNSKNELNSTTIDIQKIFIHRNNYIIFQNNNSQMTDFHFEINKNKKQIILEDYHKKKIIVNYEFIKKDSTFILKFKNYSIISKAINWKKLPALQNQIHYTIDQIQ